MLPRHGLSRLNAPPEPGYRSHPGTFLRDQYGDRDAFKAVVRMDQAWERRAPPGRSAALAPCGIFTAYARQIHSSQNSRRAWEMPRMSTTYEKMRLSSPVGSTRMIGLMDLFRNLSLCELRMHTATNSLQARATD